VSEQAYLSFQAVLQSKVQHYQRLDGDQLCAASVKLIRESGIEFDEQEKIGNLLARVAALGSFDAVAIMSALGCPEEAVVDALHSVAERSDDVMNGIAVESLAILFEEWADAEAAAGRMVKTVCPETGRNLYQPAERKP
jgi:hypothetical protein